MEQGGFTYVLFLLTILPTLGISTSSRQQAILCNATDDSRNASDSPCQINSNSSFSKTNNYIKGSSERSIGNSSNRIRNDTIPVYSGQSNTTTNLTNSRLHDLCSKDSDCKSSHGTCISLECITKNPKDEIGRCKRCESVDCKGGCYNLANSIIPTMSPGTPEITTLQLVLLFGSMGGILVVIVIVYCVKTFTDNRRRQYLLKHGVWDNKEKEEMGEDDAKCEASRQQRKLEVPTITVETEIDSSKKSKKRKENSKDEITDTDGLEEYGKAENDSTNEKVIVVDQPCRAEGGQNTTSKTEKQTNQNANHSPNATKNPYSGKTKIVETIDLAQNISTPTGWDKANEKTPLTESPKPKRFLNLKKNKDSSPTKIIANGTPEKSPRFNKHTKNPPSVQLCEPENFSDFGM